MALLEQYSYSPQETGGWLFSIFMRYLQNVYQMSAKLGGLSVRPQVLCLKLLVDSSLSFDFVAISNEALDTDMRIFLNENHLHSRCGDNLKFHRVNFLYEHRIHKYTYEFLSDAFLQ
jgi:hypothetical protein